MVVRNKEEAIARGLVYVQDVFTDRSWKVYSKEDREQICESGWIYVTTKPEGKFAAFVAQRPTSDKDFALNFRGYDHMLEGDREGRVAAAYIVLTDDFKNVLAAAHVEVVAANLAGHSPRNGQFGRYIWISREFKPVMSAGTSAYTASEDDKF